MWCNWIKIVIFLLFFQIFAYADFGEYRQNISHLKNLLDEKEQLRQQLSTVNSKIRNTDDANWLERWQLTRLHREKTEINDKIYMLYDSIAVQKEKCYHDFHLNFEKNETAINHTLQGLEKNRTDSLLISLLELKGRRDFLVDSQRYIIAIDDQMLEMNIDHQIFDDVDTLILRDFANLLKTKIINIEKVLNTAQKEKVMREKLNNFRQEVAAIHEPETQSREILSDPSWESDVDNGMINYDNSRKLGMEENYVYDSHDLINSGNDILFLLDNKDETSLNQFITKMDSLKQYYNDLLLEIDNK